MSSKRPTSAAAPQSQPVQLNDSDFESSSNTSSDEESSSDDEFPVHGNTQGGGSSRSPQGHVQGGMLAGGDESSSSSGSDGEEGSISPRRRASNSGSRTNAPPPVRQQQQQQVRPTSSSGTRPGSSSGSRQPSYTQRPSVNRMESEFSYGEPAIPPEKINAPAPISYSNPHTPRSANGQKGFGSPRLGSQPAKPATPPSRQTQGQSADSNSVGITFIPPPLDTFTPGMADICEICDDRQARIFCSDCNLRLCYGTVGANGSVQGCTVDMHRNAERKDHKRFEWGPSGRGRRVNFDSPTTPTSAVAPVERKPSTPTKTASLVAPSAPVSASSGPHTPQKQPTNPPARLVTQNSAASSSSSASSSPLSNLLTPPPLRPATTPRSACELCDENDASVICVECNMRLCWGLDTSTGQHVGCTVDMHRNSERLGHSRFAWSLTGGKGALLPFEAVLPATPKGPSTNQKDQQQKHETTASGLQSDRDLQPDRRAHQQHVAPSIAPDQSLQHQRREDQQRDLLQTHLSPVQQHRIASSAIPPLSPSPSSPPSFTHQSTPPPTSPSPSTSIHSDLLSEVLGDPAAWTSLQVCNWLTMLNSSFFSLHGRFLAHGVDGGMLLSITEGQLSRELSISDASIRKRILSGVEKLKVRARGTIGSVYSAGLVSASGRPFPNELLAATLSTLQSRGYELDDTQEQVHESPHSMSTPYTRAQLLFMLGERNKLVSQLAEENQALKRELERIKSRQE